MGRNGSSGFGVESEVTDLPALTVVNIPFLSAPAVKNLAALLFSVGYPIGDRGRHGADN